MKTTSPQQVVGRASPGWYPDPNHPDRTCYWDGAAWHPEKLPETDSVSTIKQTDGRPPWPWIVAAIAALILVAIAIAAVLLINGSEDPTPTQAPNTTTAQPWVGPTPEQTAAVLAENPGIFSEVVSGAEFASMIQLQGDTITRWQFRDGQWLPGASDFYELTFTGVTTSDFTGDGLPDYLATGTESDGYEYGTVLVTAGPEIRFASLADSEGTYDYYSPLSVDPASGRLITDLAAEGLRGAGDPAVLYWTYDPELVQFTIQE